MENNANTYAGAGAKGELHEKKEELHDKKQELSKKHKELEERKRKMWFTIGGGVALLVVGIILYKKKQTKLAATLMTNSVAMIAGAVPSILPTVADAAV